MNTICGGSNTLVDPTPSPSRSSRKPIQDASTKDYATLMEFTFLQKEPWSSFTAAYAWLDKIWYAKELAISDRHELKGFYFHMCSKCNTDPTTKTDTENVYYGSTTNLHKPPDQLKNRSHYHMTQTQMPQPPVVAKQPKAPPCTRSRLISTLGHDPQSLHQTQQTIKKITITINGLPCEVTEGAPGSLPKYTPI